MFLLSDNIEWKWYFYLCLQSYIYFFNVIECYEMSVAICFELGVRVSHFIGYELPTIVVLVSEIMVAVAAEERSAAALFLLSLPTRRT